MRHLIIPSLPFTILIVSSLQVALILADSLQGDLHTYLSRLLIVASREYRMALPIAGRQSLLFTDVILS